MRCSKHVPMPQGRAHPDINIELGLAVSALTMLPGETRTLEEIAAYCNCSRERIRQIEFRALRKMRIRLEAQGIKWADVMESLRHWNRNVTVNGNHKIGWKNYGT